MRPVKVITDSCSDLNAALLDKYNIDFVMMNTVRSGKETPASLRWTPAQAHALYDVMRGGERVTTTQVPVDRFMNCFTEYIEKGMDVVYIACAGKQSGSINTSRVVAKKLMEEHPEAYIACIDPLRSCIGEGMIAIKAALKAAEGASAQEIETYITGIRTKVHQYATVHSLDALKRAGRVTASSAFFGNLMGVKPILVADANGAQAAFKKAKGRMASMKECIALLKADGLDPDEDTVFIAHADCSQEELDTFTGMVKEAFPDKKIETCIIGPIVGASIGPDTIGIWGWCSAPFTWTAPEK